MLKDDHVLFLLYTGDVLSGGEQGHFECEADSQTRLDTYCKENPGRTVPLVPLTTVQQHLVDERELFETWFKALSGIRHLERCGDTYFGDWAACAWQGWQARSLLMTEKGGPSV
jgi:hypothetical protein